MGEDRDYWVYLPASYDDGASTPQSYPVMYLLDGGAHFQSASGVVQFMSSGINGNNQIPELIVVAILNTNRTRDLTPTHTTTGYDGETSESLEVSGGGDAFLQFIEDELFVEIEAGYRTLPHRTLVGHSLGGLMAMHALLNAPGMFQSYIAIDPSLWWDDKLLVRQAEMLSANDPALSGSVFISLANNRNNSSDGPNLMEQAEREFAALLANIPSPNLRSKMRYFDAEDHGSVPLISLYHGLLNTFEGYKLPFSDVIEEPAVLSAHYKQQSEQLGIDLLPPESLVNRIGYYLLDQAEEVDKATELFELNVANYPGSSNAYDSLGEAYLAKDDKPLAIENYERSLELDPGNENARKQLVTLRGEE